MSPPASCGAVVATGSCATALMSLTTMPETGNYTAVVDWSGLGANTVTATFHQDTTAKS
ncbi:hypothetical protein [Kutzneria kofuensis]|uniref:Uncharacterized protein n=1 Tax=Kutzneria kofuensis TaxID=103725 RepID=A0A7W9KFA3_9PSEU|nr:hypothetical protein [Kutzneria kofuensis]MBB5891357.1 hypothetical protein [Kutzneria kofuensis]